MGLLTFAQSRAVFISAVAFLALYYTVLPMIKSSRTLINATALIIGTNLFLALLAGPAVELASDLSTRVLGVEDTARTTGSFSGRSEHWYNGFQVIEGRELIGYGFRTRGSLRVSEAGLSINAHSGLLNAALDVGLTGLLLFLATYTITIWKTANIWGRYRQSMDKCAVAFLLCMIPVLVVEPNYLNFAASSNFLLLIFLARPIFSHHLPQRVSG